MLFIDDLRIKNHNYYQAHTPAIVYTKQKGSENMSVRTIEDMIDWVEKNMEETPTLDKMADHVGYSEFYCSAKFHEHVGVPFKEYVFRRKLSLAAESLMNTDSLIIDIAMQYGFSSHEAFSRAFKKTYGYSPNQFRQIKPTIPSFERIRIMNSTS